MKPRNAKISEPTANYLALYRRRWTAYFSLPFGVVLIIAGVWFIVVAVNGFSGPLGIALGLLALLTSLAIGITLIQDALRTLRSDEPALVFDEEGITYVAKESEFIPWTAIERISSNEGDGDVLGIWFKPGAGVRASVGLGTKLRRAFVGADRTIQLGGLSYRARELRDAIAKLHGEGRG